MRKDWEKWSRELRKRVQEQLDLSRELSDEEVQELIDREILKTSRENCLLLEEKLRLQKELFNSMRRLNGRKATVVHFLDDETPEYITPTVKGDQVTFTLNSLSPVAIVADGTKAAALTSPKTGDSTDFTAPLALLLLAAAGLTGCAVYSRRKKQA